jgi:RHS repeat-associated protein
VDDLAIYPTEQMDQAYTYDALHRLLTSRVGTLSGTTIGGTPVNEEDWNLDGMGNWPNYVQKAAGVVNLNQGRTASPANEISAISASAGTTWGTPAYDLSGNMTSVVIPSNVTTSLTATYDGWNRLVSLAAGSAMVATYSYDGLHRRIVKGMYVGGTLDHNEHAYFDNGWQLLEVRKEVSGTMSANPLEQYVWHPCFVNAPLLRDYDPTTSGSPTRYYYAFDANFNVTTVTGNSGAAAERYYYTPYGTLTFLNGSFGVLGTQQSQLGNTVTYGGHQLDPESGLFYCRTRFYHGALGVFCQRDSAGYRGGPGNLYEFLAASPVNCVDPFGLDPVNSGDLNATINTYPQNMQRIQTMDIDLTFVPDQKKCMCKQIAFIQILIDNKLDGVPQYATAVDPKWVNQISGDGKGSWYADVLEAFHGPYYDIQVNSGKFTPTGNAEIGNGPDGMNAFMHDGPSSEKVITKRKTNHFETCAVCIGKNTIYGCIQWGYTIDNNGGQFTWTDWPKKGGQIAKTPSGDWTKGKDAWNAWAKNNAGFVTWP